MKRRVLHLIDTGGPGGAETVCLELASRLDSARWESTLVLPERDWLWAAALERGIEPRLLTGTRSFDVSYLSRLSRLARNSGVDLIQTHLLGSAVYGAAVGRLLGLPQVSTFHGTVDVSDEDQYLAAKVRIVDRGRTELVFVSQSLSEYFESVTGARRAGRHVVYNGIDLEVFRPGSNPRLRGELGAAEGALLVGAIGNVRPAKDYHGLLRAFAVLRGRGVPVRGVVVGQLAGDLRDSLLDLRSELEIDDVVEFVGFREDVAEVLRALDILVVSSSSEGFSLSAVQALATGTPIVSTRCGGPEEILADGGGLLVPAGDPRGLADGIERMCRDAELRSRSAALGRTIAESRFDVRAMVEQYERLYDGSVADRAAR